MASTLSSFVASSSAQSVRCFHCGEAVASASRWTALIEGESRAFCCAGCRAVAETIGRAGLSAFYSRRQVSSPTATASDDEWSRYDHPAAQRGLVKEGADGSHEVSLLLEGIQCAACVWLNEAHLQSMPGVREASINYTTRRARLRWDPERVRLSEILSAIAGIGYRAYPYDPSRREALARRESRQLLLRAAIAALAMMQVMMFAIPGYLSADGVDPEYEQLFRWASLVLATPAVLFAGWPFFTGALRALRNHSLSMDVPVALGVAVAFAASVHGTWSAAGDVYYDSVTMFLALLLTSRYFELRARQRAAATVEGLMGSVPVTAERLVDYPHSLKTAAVAVDALAPGALVLVKPGAAIPADGEVLEGRSHADEALVTGESWPVAKTAGAEVLAGSVNRESQLVVRVARPASASRVSQIVRLVERAMHERPAIGILADRVAGWSVAGILLAAAAAGAYWWLADPALVLPAAVAVLVVSCPCALSLAVPTVLAATASSLAGRGVLVTRADAVEATAKLTDVVFDKTGTLTTGVYSLVGVFPLRDLARERCLAVAAALEAGSEHPIAAALRTATGGEAASTTPAAASELTSFTGCGVEGHLEGRRWRLGNPDWVAEMHREAAPLQSRLLAAHVTPVALADEQGWVALFILADQFRTGAHAAIAALREKGLRVHLLSGDRPATVAHHADALGIASFAGGLTPEDKLAWLKARQGEGARVMMVGDGVNDAPVLAHAHVSMSLATGTPLALANSDFILLGGDLNAVASVTDDARRSFRIMRENFGWAILYNVIAIPLAAAGVVTPLLAGVGMSLSSLLVVLNALRIAVRERGPRSRREARAMLRVPAAIARP